MGTRTFKPEMDGTMYTRTCKTERDITHMMRNRTFKPEPEGHMTFKYFLSVPSMAN